MLFISFLSSFQWKYQQHQDAGDMKTEIAGAEKQIKPIIEENDEQSFRMLKNTLLRPTQIQYFVPKIFV